MNTLINTSFLIISLRTFMRCIWTILFSKIIVYWTLRVLDRSSPAEMEFLSQKITSDKFSIAWGVLRLTKLRMLPSSKVTWTFHMLLLWFPGVVLLKCRLVTFNMQKIPDIIKIRIIHMWTQRPFWSLIFPSAEYRRKVIQLHVLFDQSRSNKKFKIKPKADSDTNTMPWGIKIRR